MSILKPTDPSSAIKTLNGDSANANSLINHALSVAASAYEKSEDLDTVINGEKLKDPSGEDIYQRDDDGNIIYNNDGTPVIKRDTAGLVTIVASKASISQLEAESARIDILEANSVTTETLNAEKARIDALETNKADITSLNAESARIDTLETGKANIDLANVNNAWITNGVIKDASIANEKVISVSANKLTAGTIDASKITVTNLNADNITVGTINGARIGDSSIDLGKLSQEVPTKEYLDSVEKKLQEEIDGAIETFTVNEIPTLNNEPAVNWTTDDIKSAHVGDLCYVVNSSSDNDGFCYRFQYNGTVYSWALIKDNDVTKAIQDIAELGGEVTQFKSDYTSKVSEIDGGIESLKSRTTAIETSVSTKVETSVFNTLKNTVDENSANITSLAETVTTKADSSTVTTLSNTVNEVKQTADANSSSVSSLTTTVNTKADGSKVTELEAKTSTIEQNLNGVTTRVTNVEKDMATEEFVTSQGYLTVTSDAITSKVSKDEVISAINQTAESISIDASKINLNGAVTFTSFDSSLQTTINNKAEASALEAVRNTANNAQTSINNLEIGGRNLLPFETWSKQVGGVYEKENGTFSITSFGNSYYSKPYVFGEIGEIYTISADIATQGTTNPRAEVGIYDGSTFTTKQYIGLAENTLGWATLATRNDINAVRLNFKTYSGPFIVKNLKIEKGNKATDWTPAPEDVDAGISAVSNKILSWCHENNQTLIDGAKIYTGSIDAESINVESLTADVAFIDEMETTLTRFKAENNDEYYETEITGEGINFKHGTSEQNAQVVASVSGDSLRINKTIVIDEMELGNWSWKINPNNKHLTVRWNGGGIDD